MTSQAPGGPIGEYAFWLMNRARFGFLEAVGSDNLDLLLAIDVERGAAALVLGYGLEDYLTERDLERALAEAASGFYAGDFTRGIQVCVEFIMNRMREVAKKLEESKLVENMPATPRDSP